MMSMIVSWWSHPFLGELITSNTNIFYLSHRSHFLHSIQERLRIPSLIANKDLRFRTLLCFDDRIDVAVIQRQRLLNEHIFVVLQSENGIRWMERIDTAYQDNIYIRAGNELFGARCCLGNWPCDFLTAVFDGLGRGVAEIGDLEVVGQVVQRVDV